MTYAIISDLHSNLPAVEAVLADIEREGVEEIICLGDVVGYGPFPLEVTRLVMQRAKVTLLGNHDEALIADAFNFSAQAQAAIDWTRETMPRDQNRDLWEFLGGLDMLWQRGRDTFVHGSPLDPTQEYLLPNDDLTSAKYDDVFAEFERFLFVGHTHLPCVITPDRQVRMARELDDEYLLDAEQAIVNVGSVGQPRDRDTRACYVLVDDEHIRWRRVPYDLKVTVAAIRAAGLPEGLATRLEQGK